ncbi:MAG: ornithine carbamoyltransferase [Candidatus Neomarinimicrobiota bacterium]|nr:MAG: ornithine carbamoyltransferase [Candidatus Neomarinimicrobiota bacterium]
MAKHFLHISDYSTDQIWEILHLSKELKTKFHNKENFKPFRDRSLAMIFAKPSARTRVSFETGFEWMGGHALFLGPNDIGIGKREAIKDISRLFSRYNDVIMARLFDHQHIIELAEYSDIPVINGLTDYNHPCQIICDILTIWEHKGSLDNLKICYMGDGNNIVHSWLQLASRLPMDFVCCGPEGFEPDLDTVKMVEDSASSSFQLSHDPISAVRDADVIYTDVWASMGQKEEATEREKVFAPYQVNKDLINNTGKDTLFMHCLPAERGREVTDEVMESKNSIVFDQAENRMHAQNAIMVYLTNNLS